MNKQFQVYSYNQIVLRNKRGQATDACNNMNGSNTYSHAFLEKAKLINSDRN